MGTRKVAVVGGDGIGPEVTAQAVRLLEMLDKKRPLGLTLVQFDWGAEKYLREGVGLPKGALQDLSDNYAAILFGALGDKRIPDMAHGREILLGMRFGLDLYVNYRPVTLLHPSLTPLKGVTDLDFVVLRENTEGLYANVGGIFKEGTPDEVAQDVEVNTRKGVERIVRYAFELARKRRKKVCMTDKNNAVRYGGSLWQRVFKELKAQYPDVEATHLLSDVAAMEIVRNPARFDVVVTNNFTGDILTDLGAAICGGLGVAPSANINPGKVSLFEPVHGSAPDIAGKGLANPLAAFLTTGLMLDYLGHPDLNAAIVAGARECVAAGETAADLGGKLGTVAAADALMERIARKV
ncbi:MAG: isocitrate/isopropylmalate family dehydrogenase [Myxococcota bacterium]